MIIFGPFRSFRRKKCYDKILPLRSRFLSKLPFLPMFCGNILEIIKMNPRCVSYGLVKRM
jgi:hypothetical protein